MRSAWHVLLAVAVCWSALVGWLAPQPTVAAPSLAEALVLGDSVLAGIELSPSALTSLTNRHAVVFDAKVCRRLVSTSCSYQGSTPFTALAALQANRGAFSSTLVVGAGYNDGSISAAIDAIVAEARSQGVTKVLWLTYRESGSVAVRMSQNNAALRAKALEHPEIEVLDWNSLSIDHPDWVGADGLHLRPLGALAMADLIADGIDQFGAPNRCDPALWTGTLPSSDPPDATTTAPGGAHPLAAPFRMVDTRGLTGKLGANRVLVVPIVGRAGIPADATSVLATITAVDPCLAVYLAAYPCGAGVPTSSVVNALAGETIANAALTTLGATGALCVYASEPTDVLVDVAAWIGPGGSGPTPITPNRLVDTRPGLPQSLGLPQRRLGAGGVLEVPVVSVAAGAPAVSVNLTSVDPAGAGHLTLFPGPCTAAVPNASNLNVTAGRTAAAAGTVAIGAGTICVYSSISTDVIVDLDAVHSTASHLVAAAPRRLLDTRQSTALPAGGTVALDLDDLDVGAPSGATGIVANLTTDRPSGSGFLTMYPCGPTRPEVSNLNVTAGRTVADLVVTGAGEGRRVCVYSLVATEVIIDVEGWIVP
jgi:hypothetical protein